MTSRETIRRPVGLVLVRPSQQLGSEPFYQEFIAGLESVLGPQGITLVLQVVASADAENATYERWAREGTVSAVVLVDLAQADERVELLTALGHHAVVIGDPSTAGPFTAVWTDDAAAMRTAIVELSAMGHRRIGRVSGPAYLAHSQLRSIAFRQQALALGVEASEVVSDYSEEGGSDATRMLLAEERAPTAVIYDNDLMALGGLAAAERESVRVPDDLSVLAWDDSALCQLAEPPLAVMGHDVQGIGELAAQTLLVLDGPSRHEHRRATHASFVRRASVQPPRHSLQRACFVGS